MREDANFILHDHIKLSNCLYRESSLENCLQGNLMAVLLAHVLEWKEIFNIQNNAILYSRDKH